MKNNERIKIVGRMTGPGGVKCPCCKPQGKDRKHLNRRVRSKLRRALLEEVKLNTD